MGFFSKKPKIELVVQKDSSIMELPNLEATEEKKVEPELYEEPAEEKEEPLYEESDMPEVPEQEIEEPVEETEEDTEIKALNAKIKQLDAIKKQRIEEEKRRKAIQANLNLVDNEQLTAVLQNIVTRLTALEAAFFRLKSSI